MYSHLSFSHQPSCDAPFPYCPLQETKWQLIEKDSSITDKSICRCSLCLSLAGLCHRCASFSSEHQMWNVKAKWCASFVPVILSQAQKRCSHYNFSALKTTYSLGGLLTPVCHRIYCGPLISPAVKNKESASRVLRWKTVRRTEREGICQNTKVDYDAAGNREVKSSEWHIRYISSLKTREEPGSSSTSGPLTGAKTTTFAPKLWLRLLTKQPLPSSAGFTASNIKRGVLLLLEASGICLAVCCESLTNLCQS